VYGSQRILACGLFGGLLALLAGCSGGTTADLTGTVSYKGTPLKGGQVTLSDPDGMVFVTDIATDGAYSFGGIKPGPVKLAVKTFPVNPKGPAGGNAPGNRAIPGTNRGGQAIERGGPNAGTSAPADPNQIPIPDAYADFNGNGLQTELKAGKNEYPIKMN
jgi:hypothetical protein